jgi:hypothetical protein
MNVMRIDASTGAPREKSIAAIARFPVAHRAMQGGRLAAVLARAVDTPDQLDDFALAQLDGGGSLARVAELGGASSPRPFVVQDATLFADGSAIAVGVCLEAEDPPPRSPPCVRIGRTHGFIARWRVDGTLAWSRALLPDDGGGVTLEDVLARADGSFVIHGQFNGALELRGGPRPRELARDSSGGERELFASYSESGDLEWAMEEEGSFRLWAIDEAGRGWLTSMGAMFIGAFDRNGRWVAQVGMWSSCSEGSNTQPIALLLVGHGDRQGVRVLTRVFPGDRTCDLKQRTTIAVPHGSPGQAVLWAAPIRELVAAR